MTRSGMSSTMAKVADGMRAGRGGTRMEVSGGVRRFTVGLGGNYVEDEFAPWISRRIGGRGFITGQSGVGRRARSRRQARGPAGPDHQGSPGLQHQHRSEEHTSELQSRQYLVCRLLLE